MLIGVTDHTPRRSGPAPYAAQALRYHDLNARASRPAVQAADGSCDWSELRPFVDWHVSQGMVGVHVMGGTPEHDTDETAPDSYGRKGGKAKPRTWVGYRAFVRSFGDEFSPEEVPAVSPWNEPFGPDSFDGSVSDLVAMQRICREELPGRTILTPSFYNIEHARAFLAECPRDLWDMLDVHWYGQTADQLAATLDEWEALAPGCLFAITEIGWRPEIETGGGWRWPGMTPQQRAQEWLRICRMCERRGNVALLLWYSVDGHGGDAYPMGDKPEMLAAQRAAVERTDMTTPSLFELLSGDVSALEVALENVAPQFANVITLLGQTNAYLRTVIANSASGGVMNPADAQTLRDRLSTLADALTALGANAAAAIAANQLPSTQVPAPAVGAAKA